MFLDEIFFQFFFRGLKPSKPFKNTKCCISELINRLQQNGNLFLSLLKTQSKKVADYE